ncbi:Ion channel [Teladorsagia circumcincta]|uniref:Ion channel n=1 Tax=Teladorsagia circumcincta TaxID=45464 RepID=A0A2G9UXT2_TELCI|nr:Ion channel [Teladorsagia circumcincta]
MLEIEHAKEALIWFLEHLNLTEVLNERTEDTPWTWLGSMFYAGQLYTTIGYGFPATSTAAGRVASIFYILFGIPIFLIILKRIYKSKDGTYENGGARKRDLELGPDQQRAIVDHPWSTPIFLTTSSTVGNNNKAARKEKMKVRIRTVGLGDIVFMNPDMMIFNFLLILIGLALLSMCFNLIQAALERLLNRLLEEYIEEIEKMAEIVVQDERMDEEVTPLELRMTGNLLALPMKKVTKDTGFLAEAKEWMAGRIANNLLVSRLGPSVEESDSDQEAEDEAVKEDDMHTLKPKKEIGGSDVASDVAHASSNNSKAKCYKSSISLSRTGSRSPGYDDDSLLSAAFCDLRFDCSSTDLQAVSRQHSSFSVLKVVLEDLTSAPLPPFVDKSSRRHPSCLSLREKVEPPPTTDEVFERVRTVCGLMPSDFDDHSISSRSDMVDSGYGKMHHDEAPNLLTVPSSSWSKEDTVDEQTANELRDVLADSASINQCDSSKEEPSSPTLPPTTTA